MSNISVYNGLWTNYDYSPIVGATLTIPTRWGNYLIAALSTLVGFAGMSAWALTAYFFHQRVASRRNKDILDHQIQLLCRSSSGPLESLIESAQLHVAWRTRSKKVIGRTLPLAVAAIIIWSSFIAAGVFVAEVASKAYGDVVVLGTPLYCGDLEWGIGDTTNLSDAEAQERWRSSLAARDRKIGANVKWSRTYSEAYMLGTSAPSSPFKQSILPYTATDVPCPWTINTTCYGFNRTRGGSALRMDTGLLDSHTHFGINAPLQDRIQFRKVSTCGVVDWAPFVVESEGNLTDAFPYQFKALKLLAEPKPTPNIPEPLKYTILEWFLPQIDPYRVL